MAISHDAFISYSHSADRELAPALERGLEKLAKPLLKLRALDVFRDETSLTASPALWPGIVDHLAGSEWFLLMASTASAASPWCNKEVLWWLENRSVDRMLLIVTEGEIAWDSAANDFDWNRTTALSQSLCRRFADEPLYVDMRWTREAESLSLANPRFRDVVVDIAAPLRGMRKDELDSADVRQLKRNRRLVRAGVTVIAIAAVIAIWQAIVANQARKEAERQRDEAIAGRLGTEARDAQKDKQLDLAMLLATASLQIKPTPQGASVLLSTFAPYQHPVAILDNGNNSVEALASTPDGRWLAAGHANGTVTLWDLSARPPRAETCARHDGPVHSLAFSPDGKLLATASQDTIALWDVKRHAARGKPLAGHHGDVWSLSFSRDGVLASGGVGSLFLWDLSRPTPVADLADKDADGGMYNVESVSFSPDGKLLAWTTPNDGIILWDVAHRARTGKPLTSNALRNPIRLAFSPDSSMLAVGDRSGSVVVWDFTQGESTVLRGHENEVWGLSFSPDSALLASAGSFDGKVILWDVAGEGNPIGAPLTAHQKGVSSVAFLGSREKLASGGWDGKIVIWQIDRHHPAIARLINQPIDWISSATFTADGKLMALGNEDGVFLWDPVHRRQSGNPLKTDGMVSYLELSRDGTTMVSQSGDRIFTRWDLARRKPIGKPFPLGRIDPSVMAVAVSPDGKVLASGSAKGNVTLWDLGSGAALGQPLKHEGTIFAVAFSADGKLMASGSGNGTVSIWDVARRELLGKPLKGHMRAVLCLAFSPDGRSLASGGEDGKVFFWDTERRAQKGDPLSLGAWSVTSLAITPDGAVLAAGASEVGGITLWDIESRTPIGPPLQGHSESVQHLAFNPADGKTLVSESGDGKVILWDVNPESWLERACRIASRNLTCTEWRRYLKNVPYKPVCPNLPAPACPDPSGRTPS